MSTTARLDLARPSLRDLDGLHAIYADPAVWTHAPSLRFVRADQTRALLSRWSEAWDVDGLGPWIVRLRGVDEVIGNAGVSLRGGLFWNLGYRFAADRHGHGYATEACRQALREAERLRPEVPVVASLLEHNSRSARLAERLGLTLVHRGPDPGDADPAAVRLVYADRAMDAAVVLASMR